MSGPNPDNYIFQDTRHQDELLRLRALESIFDPATRRRLRAAGLGEGSRFLEVGAGAGSIMAWASAEVGPGGAVTAVDLDTRFLSNPPDNVQVLSGDVRESPLEAASFDVIHARYVLVHIPAFQSVLDLMWRSLKPGGSLVLEEPDFSCHRAVEGNARGREAFQKIHRAINRMYEAKGIDPALGAKLPSLLQKKMGANDLFVEIDAPISPGGEGIAEMMRMSSAPLKDRYIATGEAAPGDLEEYNAFTADAASRAVYYATVSVISRK